MTVQIVTTSRKYEGLSTDTKPVTSSSGSVPVGSTFHETDTGNVAVWDGYRWNIDPSLDERIVDRLDTIIYELRQLRELHTAVAEHL